MTRAVRSLRALALITTLSAFATLSVSTSAAAAEGFDEAASDVDARLESSLRDLATERDRIAAQKIPLSRTISRLEDDVVNLRRQRDRLLAVRDSRTLDVSSLRAKIESLEEQDDFVKSRLNEFMREFEGRLAISEVPRYEAITSAAKLSDKKADLDASEKRATLIAVVEAAVGRVRNQLGGEIYEGEALGPDGVLAAGHFVALGPTVLFASTDGSVTGLVENRLNAADPVVVPLPGSLGEGVARVAQSGSGELPFDATLGKALKLEKARKTLETYIAEGGAVGYVIIALGAAAVLLALFKSVEIGRFRVAGPESVDGVLEELARGSQAAAAKQAQAVEGIVGEMLATGVQHADEPRGVLEELLFAKILGVRPQLERFLPFLAITAATAPLLGLLGTVTGMIKTFQLITVFGTGDAKSLSSGISEALVTTAEGLIVAIPVLIVHGALSRMAKRKLGLLEELSVAFINGVAAARAAMRRPHNG